MIRLLAEIGGMDYSRIKPKRITEFLTDAGLKISRFFPINIIDHKINAFIVFPSLSCISTFPTYFTILNKINEDWKILANSYSFPFKKMFSNHKINFLVTVHDRLNIDFIFYFFSYVNFFFTLDSGFKGLYKELKNLSLKLGLDCKIPKQPKWNAHILKLREIRNKSIAHWGDSRDRSAYNNLQYSFPLDKTNLSELSFGTLKVNGEPHKFLTLPETHSICEEYLLKFDTVCSEMYKQIVDKLPLRIDEREYMYKPKNTKNKFFYEPREN